MSLQVKLYIQPENEIRRFFIDPNTNFAGLNQRVQQIAGRNGLRLFWQGKQEVVLFWFSADGICYFQTMRATKLSAAAMTSSKRHVSLLMQMACSVCLPNLQRQLALLMRSASIVEWPVMDARVSSLELATSAWSVPIMTFARRVRAEVYMEITTWWPFESPEVNGRWVGLVVFLSPRKVG